MTPDDPEALGQQASAQGDDRLLAWRHHLRDYRRLDAEQEEGAEEQGEEKQQEHGCSSHGGQSRLRDRGSNCSGTLFKQCPRCLARLDEAWRDLSTLVHTQAAGHTVSGSLNSDYWFSRRPAPVDPGSGTSGRRDLDFEGSGWRRGAVFPID